MPLKLPKLGRSNADPDEKVAPEEFVYQFSKSSKIDKRESAFVPPFLPNNAIPFRYHRKSSSVPFLHSELETPEPAMVTPRPNTAHLGDGMDFFGYSYQQQTEFNEVDGHSGLYGGSENSVSSSSLDRVLKRTTPKSSPGIYPSTDHSVSQRIADLSLSSSQSFDHGGIRQVSLETDLYDDADFEDDASYKERNRRSEMLLMAAGAEARQAIEKAAKTSTPPPSEPAKKSISGVKAGPEVHFAIDTNMENTPPPSSKKNFKKRDSNINAQDMLPRPPPGLTKDKRIMTVSEFEKYRSEAAKSKTSQRVNKAKNDSEEKSTNVIEANEDVKNDDDDFNNNSIDEGAEDENSETDSFSAYDENDDENSASKYQAARLKEQQEHNLSIYRQQMRRVTGTPAPSFPDGHLSVSGMGVPPDLSPPRGSYSDDEDDIPLAILRANNSSNSNLSNMAMGHSHGMSVSGRPSSIFPIPSSSSTIYGTGGNPSYSQLQYAPSPSRAGFIHQDPPAHSYMMPEPPAPAPPPRGLIQEIAREEEAKLNRRSMLNMHMQMSHTPYQLSQAQTLPLPSQMDMYGHRPMSPMPSYGSYLAPAPPPLSSSMMAPSARPQSTSSIYGVPAATASVPSLSTMGTGMPGMAANVAENMPSNLQNQMQTLLEMQMQVQIQLMQQMLLQNGGQNGSGVTQQQQHQQQPQLVAQSGLTTESSSSSASLSSHGSYQLNGAVPSIRAVSPVGSVRTSIYGNNPTRYRNVNIRPPTSSSSGAASAVNITPPGSPIPKIILENGAYPTSKDRPESSSTASFSMAPAAMTHTGNLVPDISVTVDSNIEPTKKISTFYGALNASEKTLPALYGEDSAAWENERKKKNQLRNAWKNRNSSVQKTEAASTA
ncbi:hypothetical protein V1511DRAFT_489713 [Dipodascopsis uninucleata]